MTVALTSHMAPRKEQTECGYEPERSSETALRPCLHSEYINPASHQAAAKLGLALQDGLRK